MKKTKQDAQKTKKEIMKAALFVFGQKGYTDSSLEMIAKKAGVTRGAIYWHFENKAALYNALIKEADIRGDIVIEEAMRSGGTFKDICKRILIGQWQLLADDEEYRAITYLVMFNTGFAPDLEESHKELLKEASVVIRRVEEYVKKGIDAGQLRRDLKPIELAHAFLAYQQGVTVYWLADQTRFSIKEMAPMLADIFTNGI